MTEYGMGMSSLLRVADIDFQTDTKDFQSHGNKCAKDISHP